MKLGQAEARMVTSNLIDCIFPGSKTFKVVAWLCNQECFKYELNEIKIFCKGLEANDKYSFEQISKRCFQKF